VRAFVVLGRVGDGRGVGVADPVGGFGTLNSGFEARGVALLESLSMLSRRRRRCNPYMTSRSAVEG
jgi:hypothetical protein